MLCLTLFCQERNLIALIGLVVVPMIQTESSRSILRALTTLGPLVLDYASARLAIVKELNPVTNLDVLHHSTSKTTFQYITHYSILSAFVNPDLHCFPPFSPKKSRAFNSRATTYWRPLYGEKRGNTLLSHAPQFGQTTMFI